MIVTKVIQKDSEIGLGEIERMIHAENGLILLINKTNKNWHIIYKENAYIPFTHKVKS